MTAIDQLRELFRHIAAVLVWPIRLGLFALLGIVCVLTAGAAPSSHEVVDMAGHSVVVPAQPKHVLSLCTTATDAMLRMGAEDWLAGIDEYSRIIPGTTNLAVLGKGSAISQEQVLSRKIDLAFIWWYQDDAAQMLAGLGVPAVRIRCERADDVSATIRLIGDCVGLTNAADQLANNVDAQLETLRKTSATNAPSVYVELYSSFKTSGRDSYLNDLINLAGGRNVAADTTGPVLFSAERLLQDNPDIVLVIDGFATPETFAHRPGMDALAAVKTGRVFSIDRSLLVAGAGLPQNVAALHRLFNLNTQTKP
jgi:iron complex transport system substrate-binding protein